MLKVEKYSYDLGMNQRVIVEYKNVIKLRMYYNNVILDTKLYTGALSFTATLITRYTRYND